MGFFDRFTKSFEDEVGEALDSIRGMNLGVQQLNAAVDGKVVTLTGKAPSKEAKLKVMEAFRGLVKADNVINTIAIDEPKPEPAAAPPDEVPTVRIHEVAAGDTLGALAKKYYGKASLYMKIFEANRDILDNPDLIKVGQKLNIPE